MNGGGGMQLKLPVSEGMIFKPRRTPFGLVLSNTLGTYSGVKEFGLRSCPAPSKIVHENDE